MLTMTPAEGNQAMCVLALDPERLIIASTEKLRKLPTGSQDTADEPLLDPAIGPVPQQLGRIRTGAQAGHPRGVIHRATVIRRSEEHTSELQSRPHLVCRL